MPAARILVFCDKAEAVAASDADRAEIMVLGIWLQPQMMVDPALPVGPPRSGSAGQAIEKGMKLDPSNPRLYYLRGMSVFNTPVQFGVERTRPNQSWRRQWNSSNNRTPAALSSLGKSTG